MAFLDKVAERLAVDTFELATELGEPDLVDEVGKVIGASSTTLEEAYNTCIRYLRAEARARETLKKRTGVSAPRA